MENKKSTDKEPTFYSNANFGKLVFENSRMPIVIMDSINLRFIDCNSSAVKAYGFLSKEETIGKTPLDVSAPFQYDGTPSEKLVSVNLEKALNDGSCIFEWLHQLPNGDKWDAEVHLLRFDENGKTYLQFSLIDITERNKAKKALQESEANLKAIVENAIESIWSIDLEYRIKYLNKMFEETFLSAFGIRLTKGMNLIDQLPLPIKQLWKDRYDRVFKNEAITFIDSADMLDTTIYADLSINPIVIDNKVVGATVYSKDISSSKRYEQKLIEANKMNELIMNSIPSFIFWKDKDLNYMGCNKKFAEAAGVGDPKNIVGKTDYDFSWKKEEADFFRECDRKVIESGKSEFHIIEPQLQASGKQAWLDTNKIPLLNDKGEALGILGTYEDITERKLTEEALRESERKFKETVDFLPQLVYEMNKEGQLTFVNKQAYKTFGYTEEDLEKGLNIISCLAPESRVRVKQNIPKILNGSNSSNDYIAIKKDGTKFPVIIYSTPMKKKGVVVGLRGIVVDVTKQKNIERELIYAKEKAEESDHLKSAFLANMSHEIRTPMNGILGFSELLKTQGLSGEEQKSYIEIIEKSGNRMLNIINDLINISKIESGQMEVSLRETNLIEQLDFLFNFFNAEAKQKGIELNLHYPEAIKEATIITDKEKVYAILTNLIKNAIKFTNEGKIDFGFKEYKDHLLFYVSDTGIGIPKNKQNTVFERFIQADSSTSSGYEGSGLGLSISKGYVEILGGTMYMESEEGKGSCFYFTLLNHAIQF